MARHAQERQCVPTSLREPKPALAKPAQSAIEELYAAYLVEGLPGVGPRRARQLLEHFGSPAAVMCASAAERARAPGIGKKSAERIWRATHTELAREHNA
jgi:ERCC4-type nuclease